MERYESYDKTEAFTGEYETLTVGGKICRILKIAVESKDYGKLMRVAFDIAEGENAWYYKRLFDRKKETNPDAKWAGMYYQTIKDGEDMKYFKGFMTAIENSNPGFKWDWDENKLIGKLFGGVFAEEEYKGNDGDIKVSVKCRFVRSVEQIRKGVKIPEIKRLNKNAGHIPVGYDHSEAEADLPF